MNRYTNCSLPIGFPGVTFNGKGECELCQGFDTDKHLADINAARTQLDETIKITKQLSAEADVPYDAIVALSGGKDSCFTLQHLVRTYSLKCLALTVDNGLLSAKSIENSRKLCDRLGVDFVLWKPTQNFMNSLYMDGLENTKPRDEQRGSIVRASDLCNNCINLINSLMLKEALTRNIPLIAGGYIAGQVPRGTCVMKMKLKTLFSFSAIKNATENPQLSRRRYHLTEADRTRYTVSDTVNIINPMLSLNYNEKEIISCLDEFGWARPEDTGNHSSNCRINDLGIRVHLSKYGFHPYEQEIAEQVRTGNLTRGKAIEKLESPLDEERLQAVETQLRNDE